MNWFNPAWSLMWREWTRFYRQRGRIIGSLVTPFLFWLFLGTGLSAAFPAPNTPSGKGFVEYFYPGNLALTVLFTAIFSTISIIEDRKEGFLQGVLVAPVDRLSLAVGKILGGTVIAVFQGVLFLLLLPISGIHVTVTGLAMCLLAIFVMSYMLTALGFLFAWWFDSIQSYHSIMNMVLFPMWLLSGAFFPVGNAPWLLRPLVWCNPLTYGLAALKAGLYEGYVLTFEINFLVGISVCLLFAVVFSVISAAMVASRKKVEVSP